MVYTAAQTNAQEFIEMIFSTSAGQIVFNAYKDKTPLPEDVARENGHDELARYLQDVHARYFVKLHVGVQTVTNITISHPHVYYPRRDFAQKARSRGGTLITRTYVKESTYS